MSKTRLTEDRICTVLRGKLYSMADNENHNMYEPLQLKWVLPVESTQGLISLFKNVIFLLDYVQKNRCSRDIIDKIIENEIRLMVSRLSNEYDFFIAATVIIMCSIVDDFSDSDGLMKLVKEIMGKFIYLLETVAERIEQGGNGETSTKKASLNDDIDISKLEVGLVIPKGYPELCKLVGEKCFKSGSNQRKAQEKRFKRYIKWEKSEFNSRTIIITDIYDEPLPKDDKRQLGNNNIYAKYIESIILRYVYYKHTENQICYITKNQLWRILGMINENYKKIPFSILTSDAEYCDVKKWELDNFYMRCNSKLNSILFKALRNLRNRSLIDWNTQIMIVVPAVEGKFSHHYIADDEEIKKILAVERRVLKDMGFESKSHVMCKMKMPQFYQNVNNLLFELYGWERKYERIKLNFNKTDVREALLQDEYKLKMLLLNDLVIEAIDKNAQVTVDNRFKKALMEYEDYTKDYFGKPPRLEDVKDIFTYPQYFVDIQKKLSQKFLSIKNAEKERKEKKNSIRTDNEIDDLFGNLGFE